MASSKMNAGASSFTPSGTGTEFMKFPLAQFFAPLGWKIPKSRGGGENYRGGAIKDNLETRAALYPASMGSFQPKGWMSVTLTDHVRAAMSSLLFVSAELSSFSSSECSRSNNSNLSRLGALFDVPLCVSLGEVGG